MHGPVVMRRMAQAQGRIVRIEALLGAMYPVAQPDDALGVLRVTILRLRRRLPEGAIATHVGEGYSLAPEVGAAWLAARDG
jgi:DNA-binding response OmpR family regulator